MPWPTKQSNNDDGETLRLEKEKVIKILILEDEPELYYTHYVNGKTAKCTAPDCPQCLAAIKRDTKGSIKVKDLSDGKEKRLKGTAALFTSIHEVLELCGSRKGFLFAIKATGEKKDRRYHVTALPATGAPMVSAPAKEDEDEDPFKD